MTEPVTFQSEAEAFAFFDRLPPLTPAEMIGLWQGRSLPSGHPLDGVLDNLGWYGKRFRGDLRADPLLFRSGERLLTAVDPGLLPLRLGLRFHRWGRSRAARNIFSYLQRRMRARGPVASLKSQAFRTVVSAAMIYDRQPVTDYFRRLDADRVMGAMKIDGEPRHYFFELTRRSET